MINKCMRIILILSIRIRLIFKYTCLLPQKLNAWYLSALFSNTPPVVIWMEFVHDTAGPG